MINSDHCFFFLLFSFFFSQRLWRSLMGLAPGLGPLLAVEGQELLFATCTGEPRYLNTEAL